MLTACQLNTGCECQDIRWPCRCNSYWGVQSVVGTGPRSFWVSETTRWRYLHFYCATPC